jgi:ABC-type branched-subunit amino acid transport system substrate-binding protein
LTRRFIVLAITIVGALGVVVSGAVSSSSAKSSGAPIVLMALGPINAPIFSLPGIEAGAAVAVNELDKAGGLNGRRFKLIICNDKNDPSTATDCARQAITDHVVAMVGGLSLFDVQIVPLLAHAGIPWVGLVTGDDYTSPNLFLPAEGAPDFVGIGMTLAAHGCKKIAVVVSAAAETQNAAQIAAGVKAGGAQVAGTFTAPSSSSDWAPTVAAARAAGADCIGSGTGPSESGGLLAAENAAGPWLHLAFSSGGFPPALVAGIGAGANGVLEPAGEYPYTAHKGVMQKLKSEILASFPATDLDPFATVGYASVKIVADALKGLTQITAATLTKALPKVKGFDTGVGIVATLTHPNPVKAYARVYDSQVYTLQAENGQVLLTNTKPIDTTPGLKILAGQ